MNSILSPALIILFKWTVLLALGWAAHWLLRERHSHWRLILWRSIFCFGLLVPLARFAPVPLFRIPIYGTSVSATVLPDVLPQVPSSNPVSREQTTAGAPAKPAGADFVVKSPNPPLMHTAAKAIPWKSLLVMVCALGAVFSGLRLARLQVQLRRLRQESRPASSAVQEQARVIKAKLGVRRKIVVQASDAFASPFVCGLWHPAIMLPQKLVQDLQSDEISALLAHEIAHFRGNDLFWCVGWRWMQALFWFHPLVWNIPAVHNLACEEEADRIASGQLQDPGFYPQLLARLALRVLALPAVETRLALNGTSQIAHRLRRLGKAGSWKWRHSAAGFSLAGLVCLVAVGCDFSKKAPAHSSTATSVEFKEVRVVVQDWDGRPIEGATVQPTGYRMKGVRWQDAFYWNEKLFGPPVKVRTDGQGQASIKYPVVGNPEENDLIGKLFLWVSHPEFAGARTEYAVDEPQKPVRLTRGIHLDVSGYLGAEHQPVTDLIPQVNQEGLRPEDWQKMENGGFALHTLSPGGHLLQLMGRLPSGEIVFSDSCPFTAVAGQEYHFALEMKPGIRLEGRIDDHVPRPVKNGRILISIRPKEFPASLVTGPSDASKKYGYVGGWKSYRSISEDGSFVFESVPPGEADVVVHGDGFVSRSIGHVQDRIPVEGNPLVDGPAIGIPQPFGLTAPVTTIEVLTEPAATLELTAKTKNGKPIAGATVLLNPNVLRMGGLFGEMGRAHSSEEPFRTLAPLPRLYTATTDVNGVAVIRNVPGVITHDLEVFHPQFDLPLEGRHRIVRVNFLPGETNKVEVTLVAKGDSSRDVPEDVPGPKAVPGMSLLDRAAAHVGATGQDDPDLLKLADTLVAFIRERDPRIFKDQACVTTDQIWAALQQSGQKGPSREEINNEMDPHIEGVCALARSAIQQMEDAGIDLKNATVQVKEASVERLRSPPGRKSVIGLSGEQFKLKIAVKTRNKAKNGTSLSGDYILAANEIVRFPKGWRVTDNIHWAQLPSSVLDAKAVAAMQFENHVAETGTLPLASIAPEIEFTTLAGEKGMKLSDLRGKVVILEFWATWCGPCQEPMATLQTLRQAHPDWKDQVVIVPLSIDDNLKIEREHVDQRGWTNTLNVWAGAGGWESKPAAAFRVRGVPTTYIIDGQGHIVKAGHPATMDVGQEVDSLLKL